MSAHKHPASRECPWYEGYEPEPPCPSRAEERDEDDWDEYYLWRRWLARRGYTNRAPRDRGYRRERARVRQEARTRYWRRVKAHLNDLQPYHFANGVKPDVQALAADLGRRFRDLRQPCSCNRCGNPRRHFGTPTVGELREAEAGQLDAPLAFRHQRLREEY